MNPLMSDGHRDQIPVSPDITGRTKSTVASIRWPMRAAPKTTNPLPRSIHADTENAIHFGQDNCLAPRLHRVFPASWSALLITVYRECIPAFSADPNFNNLGGASKKEPP